MPLRKEMSRDEDRSELTERETHPPLCDGANGPRSFIAITLFEETSYAVFSLLFPPEMGAILGSATAEPFRCAVSHGSSLAYNGGLANLSNRGDALANSLLSHDWET